MNVLVTGADGLLGSNLVRELLEKNIGVRVFLQPNSKSKTLDGLPIEKVSGDLLDDSDALAEAMRGCGAVFHCAAITDQWAAPELTWKVNFDGTVKVLDSMKAAGVKKLVFVGSASSFQFGTLDRPGDETAPFPEIYRGVAYMESKHRASDLVRERAEKQELEAVIVAPTFLLGPYDARPSSGELIRQFIVRRMKFTSPGGRNFVHARDAARAMAAALDRGRSGETYILGGNNLTYLDFFSRVAKAYGMSPPRTVLPAPVIIAGGAAGSAYEKISGRKAMINLQLASLAVLGTYYSPKKAMAELGMEQTPADQAIADSIRGLVEYGHIEARA